MNETPDQRVTRLQAELAKAKVDQLQAELDEARQATGSGGPSPALASFTAPAAAEPGTLADPPRRVPLAMRLLLITWSWWAVWALFMVAVAPISLWQSLHNHRHDALELALMQGFLVAVLIWLMRKTWQRQVLLRRGVVAHVTGTKLLSRGTYYSGVTYQNTYLAQAHGWKVTRRLYSGPASKTQISYDVGGQSAQLTLRGLPYTNGVILADPSRPSRALCVSQFPYDLDRDGGGDWVGTVSPRVLVGSLAMWLVAAGWTIQALRIYHGAGLH